MALTAAASDRWDPDDSPSSVDEDDAPVFGDAEYDDLLKTAEDLADCAAYRNIALYFGLPHEVVDSVVASRMSGAVKKTPSRSTGGVVVRRRNGNQED